MFGSAPVDDVTHVIQVALAPAFLLSALATLLNVFTTRLGRVADLVDGLAVELERADRVEAAVLSRRLARLRARSLVLDAAVVLGTLGGAFVSASILTLFVGALRNATVAGLLFWCFGAAIVCGIGALGAFLVEMLMAGRALRDVVAAKREEAEERR